MGDDHSVGTRNALDNYKRVSRQFLKEGTKRTIGGESVAGEQVIIATIDGYLTVTDVDDDGHSISDSHMRRRRASLLMTERHAIAYQARTGMHSDYGIAVPYDRVRTVEYEVMRDGNGKATFEIRFVPKVGSQVPLVTFDVGITDVFAYDGILKTISSACAISGTRLSDMSDAREMAAMGLRPLT